MGEVLEVKAPAKINLFLYITGRKSNGYHELLMLMRPISLHDRMRLEFNRSEITVSCRHPNVPEDDSNLVVKAAKQFVNGCNDKFKRSMVSESRRGAENDGRHTHLERYPLNGGAGVHIEIDKQIPVGAGLGGGSSNAAAVLKTMNHFYGSPFSNRELKALALGIGADVPFFVDGQDALVQGIGEQLTPCPAHELPRTLLLFYPGYGASTAEVYKNIDLALTKPVKFNINSLLKTSGEKPAWDAIMHNDLETAACRRYPWLGEFRDEISRMIPERVMMTGSGSTFFALFSDAQMALEYHRKFTKQWEASGKKVYLASFSGI